MGLLDVMDGESIRRLGGNVGPMETVVLCR